MKTERITLLVTPEFKHFLSMEAKAEGVSVSELIRARCEQQPSPDEQLLSSLAKQLRESTEQANKALDVGLAAVDSTRATIRKLRAENEAVA